MSDDVIITAYRDGPLLVRGPVRIQDMHGNPIVVERETVALCRCGKSRIRPLCDGTHKLVRFRAPSAQEDRGAGSASAWTEPEDRGVESASAENDPEGRG